MDDLKLYSKNDQEQVGQLKLVKQFNDDIGMTFGLEKCAKASFKRGKLVSTGNIEISDDTAIQELNQEEVYKYLGVDKSDGIQHSKMKEKIRKEYYRRVKLIFTTELNGRNKMEAINSLAVPVVQYSFGIIDWKISEIKKVDPKTDVERLYLHRKERGRGLIELETAFKAATIGLDHYLKYKENIQSRCLILNDLKQNTQ